MPNKLGAVSTTDVDGSRFPSKLEAACYAHLKLQKMAGDVLYFLRQVPFHLPGGVIYRIDFQVFYTDGRVRYLEPKGYETESFKIKWRQVEALYPIKIELVRKYRGRLIGL